MSISETLEKSKAIIEREIDKIDVISKLKEHLDECTSKQLCDYNKTLILLDKNERESAKADDLTKLTDEEIEQKLHEAITYLSGAKGVASNTNTTDTNEKESDKDVELTSEPPTS